MKREFTLLTLGLLITSLYQVTMPTQALADNGDRQNQSGDQFNGGGPGNGNRGPDHGDGHDNNGGGYNGGGDNHNGGHGNGGGPIPPPPPPVGPPPPPGGFVSPECQNAMNAVALWQQSIAQNQAIACGSNAACAYQKAEGLNWIMIQYGNAAKQSQEACAN